jgi:hypothetical protein
MKLGHSLFAALAVCAFALTTGWAQQPVPAPVAAAKGGSSQDAGGDSMKADATSTPAPANSPSKDAIANGAKGGAADRNVATGFTDKTAGSQHGSPKNSKGGASAGGNTSDKPLVSPLGHIWKAKTHDHASKIGILTQPRDSAKRKSEPHQQSARPATTRNAIGARVDNVATAPSVTPQGSGATPLPSAANVAAGSGARTGPNAGVALNATASPTAFKGNASAPVPAQNATGPAAVPKPPVNSAVITGTGIVRRGTGAAAVGGAARNVAAVINGTTMRPKH